MNYTLFSQIQKTYLNLLSLSPKDFLKKIKVNDYSKKFMDENNDEPLLSLVGSIEDLLTGRLPNIKVIQNLDINKYMGQWYEIARFDSSFEPKEVISAEAFYELDNGLIKVRNTGVYKDGRREVINGVASSKYSETNIGKLNVSFFPPFTGDYWIIMLADDYRYSVVTSPNGKFLWILGREETISESDRTDILSKLTELEYDVSKLNWRG